MPFSPLAASTKVMGLLLDRLDALPSAAQTLLPQANTVVTSADGEDVTAKTPAHTPGNGVDVENG